MRQRVSYKGQTQGVSQRQQSLGWTPSILARVFLVSLSIGLTGSKERTGEPRSFRANSEGSFAIHQTHGHKGVVVK